MHAPWPGQASTLAFLFFIVERVDVQDRAKAAFLVQDTIILMERVEYSVLTKASPELVWKTFSNWHIWPLFSNIYEDIRWVQGHQPWKPGSRLEIKVIRPVRMIVDHVIIACAPAKHIAWIDHAMGNTMEQWVVFDGLPDGGTRVRTWAEFTGMTLVLAGRPLKECIDDFITGWYQKFAEACDRQARGKNQTWE